MKVLITGAKGFVGKNLTATIDAMKEKELEMLPYDIDTDPALLPVYTAECDFVVHLAGVNRPENTDDFMKGNFGFTSELLQNLIAAGNKAPILITSSIQAALDNPYGRSKKAGEDLLFDYGRENGVPVYVYRMPNVFGKWCRPNYNSAVATFCHNIARNLPITVSDPAHEMQLVYVDDVVAEILRAIEGNPCRDGAFCRIHPVHTATLGHITELLYGFRASRDDLSVPELRDPFVKALHATYLSYLPEGDFSYPLKMNRDQRGSFTEILRTAASGQFSVNISKPGITKGNHWHHTKNEKFLVVAGQGVIRFRRIDSETVTEYRVSGDALQVVDIPPGYTHNIENLGDTDMVTFMWCNECFDSEKPDTYFLPV